MTRRKHSIEHLPRSNERAWTIISLRMLLMIGLLLSLLVLLVAGCQSSQTEPVGWLVKPPRPLPPPEISPETWEANDAALREMELVVISLHHWVEYARRLEAAGHWLEREK